MRALAHFKSAPVAREGRHGLDAMQRRDGALPSSQRRKLRGQANRAAHLRQRRSRPWSAGGCSAGAGAGGGSGPRSKGQMESQFVMPPPGAPCWLLQAGHTAAEEQLAPAVAAQPGRFCKAAHQRFRSVAQHTPGLFHGARPNPSLKLTRYGRQHLAAPGPVGYFPSAAKRCPPPRSA